MFCDGIRPGSDLTNLDADFNYSQTTNVVQAKAPQKKTTNNTIIVGAATTTATTATATATATTNSNTKVLPVIEHESKSFIPTLENSLPPTVNIYKSGTLLLKYNRFR